MNFRKLSLILGCLYFIFDVHAQVAEGYDDLDLTVQKGMETFGIPGASVGIIKGDDIILLKGYGLLGSGTEKETNGSSVFGIASCSKAFTAACIAILVDEDKLGWEDKVIDHMPEFQLFDPYITRELTISDLLSHRAGYQTFDGDLLWYGTDYSREEILSRFRYRENPFSFRSRFGYSNIMFIAAGEVIKSVTGKTWEKFVEERIFIPLDMAVTNTTTQGLAESENIALPHHKNIPMGFIDYDNSGPAASINSSAEDLLHWARLWLNKGNFEDKEIFSNSSYYAMTRSHTVNRSGKGESINGTHFNNYGLGWFLQDYGGRKVIQHGGGLPGFHSKVVFVPEDTLSFVILANQLSGFVDAVYKEVLDYFLFDSGRDWIEEYDAGWNAWETREEAKRKQKEEGKIPGTKPSLEISDYTGIYKDKMYGKAEISEVEGKLKIVLEPAAELFTGTLEHWHFDTFRFRFADPFLPEGYVIFFLDNEGYPTYFTIDLENPDFHFFKLKFEKQVN